MTTLRQGAVLILLAGLLSGCAAPPPPRDSFYRLEVAASPALAHAPLHGVVEVSHFGAEGLTGERALLYSYRDKPDQVLRYSYHLWTEPPASLLEGQLVRVLRAAHAATSVVTADLRVPPDYVIEGRLRRFEQLAGARPAVLVEIDLGVVRVHGNALLLLRTYKVEKPSRTEQVPDAVAAFQAAVGEVFAQFLDDLSRTAVAS